ncbi:hypothetical protein SAMN02745108_02499, partial [Fibrobacter intestinalis]
MFFCKTICIWSAFVAAVNADVISLSAEIKNEQPYSLDNNAIRVRVFNHGIDTLKQMSFCYR